jgi:hypothetical protein
MLLPYSLSKAVEIFGVARFLPGFSTQAHTSRPAATRRPTGFEHPKKLEQAQNFILLQTHDEVGG